MEQFKIDDMIVNAESYLHNVLVDNVILGYHDKELKVLLQQPKYLPKWGVTGGYIKRDESILEAAERISWSRTGLKGLFLQQFQCFGEVERGNDIDKNSSNLRKLTGREVPDDLWIFDRFVSVAFYTLTEFSKATLSIWEHDADCRWWSINELPPLMFDHRQIILEALRALRMHIAFFPIGYELLPEKFTLPEIHKLYETILGRSLDERNFQKRLLASGIVIKLDEKRKLRGHRSPFLYQFDKAVYDKGLKSGLLFGF